MLPADGGNASGGARIKLLLRADDLLQFADILLPRCARSSSGSLIAAGHHDATEIGYTRVWHGCSKDDRHRLLPDATS